MVSVVEKKFWPIFRAILGPNLVQNLVFGSKLDVDSCNLSDITHSDFILWFLDYKTIKGFFCVKKAFQLYVDIDLFNICLNAC